MPDTGPPTDLVGESSQSLEVDQEAVRFGDKRAAKGPLLMEFKPRTANEKKLAKLHLEMWKAQDHILERPMAQWGVNAARRFGITNAMVLHRRGSDDLDAHWTSYLPSSATPDTTPIVNKAATLCRRMSSQMYIDPFVAEVVLPDGDDDDQAAAEISERALHDLQDEHNLNEAYMQRRSFDRSHTYGSGYIEYWVDEQGGGQRAVKIEARADAEVAQLPFTDPLTGQEGPQMQVVGADPATGAPISEPVPFVERFVNEDGDFVETAADAAIEYLPKLKSQVLDSRYVRLLPHTAQDIWDAQGVMIAAMPTWAEVKKMAPEIADLPPDTIKKMLGFRPKFAANLIPGGVDAEDDDSAPIKLKDGKTWNDERHVLVLKSYHLRSPEYPKGLFLITIGGQFVLHRSDWIDDSEEEEKDLDLPLTQHCGFDEGRDGYWKVGLMELVGPGNELRAAQIAHLIDHLEKLNNIRIFLPTNSIIQPQQLQNPRATVLPMNPGGKPEFEDVPRFPSDAYTAYQEAGQSMDEAAGLREQSGPQGQSNVKSGRHEFAIVSQIHAGLAEPRSNAERAYIRSCRITLQLARAFFEDEQEARYAGQGGLYRLQSWKGADLVTQADIRIKPGSGTMLAPAAKAQLAERYASLQVIDHDDLREVITTNIGGTIGLQDNPHRMRIKRQIAEWEEGPPEGWQPMDPDPTSGAPGLVLDELGNPTLTDPELGRIWAPVPADVLPAVAASRLKQIADTMAGPKYQQAAPEWRVGPDAEFQRMQMALMPQQAPQGDVEAGAEGEEMPGDEPLNDDGTPLNDLQEDALQEGAPPEMVT